MNGDGLVYQDGRFEAVGEGTASIEVTDKFTGALTSFTATTLTGLAFETYRAGDHIGLEEAIGAGDIDGDGYPDAVLGVAESNVDWVNSGGVYIYAGGTDGLGAAPVRVISGPERLARFGGRVAAADVDADGHVDLLVGASRANAGGKYAGAVYLYRGVPSMCQDESSNTFSTVCATDADCDEGEVCQRRFFEEEPSQMWSGDFSYDYFGYSLTVCDFNGDSKLDLAVAAYQGEDRDQETVVSNQGVVHLFLGTETGLPISATMKVWGVGLDDAGQWAPAKVELGQTMASGDMNQDGRCELVVSVLKSKGDSNRDGGVYMPTVSKAETMLLGPFTVLTGNRCLRPSKQRRLPVTRTGRLSEVTPMITKVLAWLAET
jgi:hypothetical protein